ncbi:MAG: hypothetical protein KF861_04970, partial [Planctomycetaceae bacterium]|nr:hypothetical protein [Planctomycetaceae bacterium]
PQFPGLADRTGATIDPLIENAASRGDWRRARHFYNRLRTMFPEHSVVTVWRGRFNEAAEQRLLAAERAREQGDHRTAIAHADEAATIWPAAQNLRARHRSFADRYQRLRVGVMSLPSITTDTSGIESADDERVRRLTEVRMFEVDRADEGTARYHTRFCDRWEPLNLGRSVVFDLRSSRQPWEAQPLVTAPLIAEQIANRIDPSHALYDERLASYVGSVEVHAPYSFTLRFDRVPVRTEAVLSIPVVGPGEARRAAASTTPVSLDERRAPEQSAGNVRGGFQLRERNDFTAAYERALPEPEALRQYHLAEVQEHLYSNADAALQGLLRGEVSMLVRTPAPVVELLRNDEQLLKAFFVEKMALPVTHVIQFHPRSPAMKNREYRRALAYAIDRQRILNDVVLKSSSSNLGRLVNGPFPSRSDVNNALVRGRSYDPLNAISLTLAARQQLAGELPPLRMAVVNDPVAQAAAQELIASWARFGIVVQRVELPQGPLVKGGGESVEWDLLYRTVQMAEPATELWPFLTLSARARVADLDPFPDWLRQEIIALDLASDWKAALQSLNTLHLHLWGEVMLIPLWEVDDYLIYRKNVRGVPVAPVHPYQDADRWIVEAWYPEDEP